MNALQPSPEWSDWSKIHDREEIHHRLEQLASVETLNDALVAFLLFFFRSSDPLLYQTAAHTAGIHLHRNSLLEQSLTRYAKERGVDLAAPIELNGHRTRRRLLLLATTAAVSPRKEEAPARNLLQTPLKTDTWRDQTRTSTDCAVYLMALSTLLSGPEAPENLLEGADSLIGDIAHARPLPLDRNLIQRWGSLLGIRLAGQAPLDFAHATSLWSTLFERLLKSHGASTREMQFGRSLALLNQLDEMLHTLVKLPETAQRMIIEQEAWKTGPRDTEAFCVIRSWTWARREAIPLSGFWPKPLETTEEATNIIERLADTVSVQEHSRQVSICGNPEEQKEATLIQALLQPMTQSAHWRSLSVAQRALHGFLLMDLTLYGQLSGERWQAALESYGIAKSDVSSMDSTTSPQAIADIVLRLLELEMVGADDFIESRLLHRMRDERVLLALLPPHAQSELIPLLADAFEHRLRQNLRANPEFSLGCYLYRILVRSPHLSFFHSLKAVCAGRSYIDSEGNDVPVTAWIEWLLQEKQSDDEPSSAPSSDTFTAYLESMHSSEPEKLEPSIAASVLQLAEKVGGRTTTAKATWIGLVRFLAKDSKPIRSGYPAFGDHLLESLEREVGDAVDTMVESTADLNMPTVDALPEARSALSRIQRALLKIETRLPPFLPAPERQRFLRELKYLRERLQDWNRNLTSLQEVWNRPTPPTWEETVNWWNTLKVEATGLADGANKAELAHLLIHSLWTRCGDDRTQAESDPWEMRARLVAWLWQQRGPATEQDALLPTATTFTYWRNLVEEALEHGFASRVSRLLELACHHSVTAPDTDNAAFLEQTKRWLLSVYRLRDAGRANYLKASHSGHTKLPLIAFIAQFSPIWISVLIGAIFMLDFGDPWTAMAEVGDLRGIALTFLLSLGATYLYLLADHRRKVKPTPPESIRSYLPGMLGRTFAVLMLCLSYAFLITGFLWFLLSGTDEVLHGPEAILHISVWAAFALFVGVFFGLIAKAT